MWGGGCGGTNDAGKRGEEFGVDDHVSRRVKDLQRGPASAESGEIAANREETASRFPS